MAAKPEDEPTEQTPLVSSQSKPRMTLTQIVAGTGSNGTTNEMTVDDSGNCLDQDDCRDIVVYHEVEGNDRRRTTIFAKGIEDHIEKTDSQMHSWLGSLTGLGFQGMIILVYIAISVYEAVCKKKALVSAKFDFTSIVIFQGVFSVIASFCIALFTGRLPEIFNRETPKKLALYFPVGVMFSTTAYLQFLILMYLAVDVFKILEQGRLLVTAVITMMVFKKNQSMSSWCALVVITLAAISYGQIAQLEKGGSTGQSNNFMIGFVLTLIFIFVQCFASIYCELILKKDKHMPFFIQKFYLEVPGTLFGLLLAWKADDWLVAVGLKDAAAVEAKVRFFVDGPFAGWWVTPEGGSYPNPWVVICFTLYVMKSWGSGFLCKMMSSLVKQLCSVTAVGVLYFFALIHLGTKSCLGDYTTFFCPSPFSRMTVSGVVGDFCVLWAVTSYTFAQRDKRRKVMYREEAEEAKFVLGEKLKRMEEAK